VEIHGRLLAGVDGEGSGMGGKETKVAPKDWPTGHDVDRSSTQYKLTPQMAYKNIFFSLKNRSKCKYRGKSPKDRIWTFSASLRMNPASICPQKI
jgi:hypothetical protein